MSIQDFALNLIQNNPQVANNPMTKELINIIKSGDVEKGQKMAQNICDSYGVTREQALQQARQHFKFPV